MDATIVRQVASAIVWCGYLLPAGPDTAMDAEVSIEPRIATDEHLAELFKVNRAAFVRDRGHALRLLKVLENSLQHHGSENSPQPYDSTSSMDKEGGGYE